MDRLAQHAIIMPFLLIRRICCLLMCPSQSTLRRRERPTSTEGPDEIWRNGRWNAFCCGVLKAPQKPIPRYPGRNRVLHGANEPCFGGMEGITYSGISTNRSAGVWLIQLPFIGSPDTHIPSSPYLKFLCKFSRIFFRVCKFRNGGVVGYAEYS